MRKTLTFGIVLLFIGVAFAPSFYADVETINEQNELIELTVEFYGLDKTDSHQVTVTREDSDKLDSLFNEFKNKLNETNSIEETIIIYEWAIDELNKLGLLGDLSVDEAKKLVTGGFYYKEFNELFNTYRNTEIELENLNFLCLISGETTENDFTGPINSLIARTLYFLVFIKDIFDVIPIIFLMTFPIIIQSIIHFKYPFSIYNTITYGQTVGLTRMDYYSSGWVKTLGLLGYKEWQGKIIGYFIPISTLLSTRYSGVIGFTGIHICDVSGVAKYFGFANAVNLKQIN